MNQTTRFATLALAAALATASAYAQPTTAPSASDVLQQLKRLDRAAADMAVGSPDPQVSAAQQAEKASLVKQLIAAPQQAPETIKYLGDRWRGISPTHSPALVAEVDGAIRNGASTTSWTRHTSRRSTGRRSVRRRTSRRTHRPSRSPTITLRGCPTANTSAGFTRSWRGLRPIPKPRSPT